MEFFLADVTWENLILVGTAMGIFTGSKVLHTRLTNKGNGNGKYSKQLCDTKHANLGASIDRIDKNVDKIFDNIDTIKEHLMK